MLSAACIPCFELRTYHFDITRAPGYLKSVLIHLVSQVMHMNFSNFYFWVNMSELIKTEHWFHNYFAQEKKAIVTKNIPTLLPIQE